MSRIVRSAIVLALLFAASPARADWYATPFVATTFGLATDLVDLSDTTSGTYFTFGGSVTRLGSGMLGFEGDFGRVNRGANSLVLKSNVTTLMGNVVVAVPLSVSGYGLRPFASAGSGLMRATTRDLADVVSFHRNLFALNVGGGVIGPLSDKRAVRFDVRYFRNIRTVGEGGLIENRPSLSFWRASAGFMFKF